MSSRKLSLIIAVAVILVAILVSTAVVFAGTRNNDENVREIPDTTSATIDETIPETIPETVPDETIPTTETTEEPDVSDETDDSSPTTPTTTQNTTPNYKPTQTISGQADVVKENSDSDVPDVVVVEKEDTAHYEDEDVSAIVLPTVVTPSTTFGTETTENITPTTNEIVRTDIVNPSAMDDNVVEEEVVGVELEEVVEDEMPDFLP